jgi:hypothetical protein
MLALTSLFSDLSYSQHRNGPLSYGQPGPGSTRRADTDRRIRIDDRAKHGLARFHVRRLAGGGVTDDPGRRRSGTNPPQARETMSDQAFDATRQLWTLSPPFRRFNHIDEAFVHWTYGQKAGNPAMKM